MTDMAWFELSDKRFQASQLAVPLIELCIQRGANTHGLLRGTGLFYPQIKQAPELISAAQLFALISQAEKQVKSQDLSFLLGRRVLLNQPDAMRQMLLNGRNLADTLRMLHCYQHQVLPLAYFKKESTKHHHYMLFNSAFGSASQQRFWVELTFTAINAGCKQLFGHQIPLHFYFAFPRPRNIYQYEENLGHRLHFDQPLTMLSVEQKWLHQPLPNSDKDMRYQGWQFNQQQRKTRPRTVGLVQAISVYLNQRKNANLEEVATQLQLSPASLKRKLREHQLSFTQVQDQVRRQQAVFELKIRNSSNQQVAERLNINNLNNFRRAFKRWTGMTPSQLKAR